MTYPFNEDHDMIREAANGFLQDWYDGGKGPERIFESGVPHDAEAWQGLAQELGMAGVAIPEEHGGAGLGDLGRVVVMEELGASLCSVPFLTTCGVAADMIEAFGSDDVKSNILPKIASGELTATYFDGHDADGAVKHVVYAANADLILSSRRKGQELEIIAIETGTKGLNIIPYAGMDPTRGFAHVDITDVSEENIRVVGKTSEDTHRRVVITSQLALAAECIGGARACLDMTLEYTGQRVQFGRTIASFQAIKHRVADMFIALEEARSAVYAAAIAPENEKIEAAMIAKAVATENFYKIAGDAIQMHGGIGFTWEYPLHYFFKRARANKSMFGTPEDAYEMIAQELLGNAA